MAQDDPWAAPPRQEDPWAPPPRGGTVTAEPPEQGPLNFEPIMQGVAPKTPGASGGELLEPLVRGAETMGGRMLQFGGQAYARARNAVFQGDQTRAELARNVQRAGVPGEELQAQALTHPEPTSFLGKATQGIGQVGSIAALGPLGLGLAGSASVEDRYNATLKATGSETKATEAAVMEAPIQILQMAPIMRLFGGATEGATLARKAVDGMISGAVGVGGAHILGGVVGESISKEDKAQIWEALKSSGMEAVRETPLNMAIFGFLGAASGMGEPKAAQPELTAKPETNVPAGEQTAGPEPTQKGEAPPPELAPNVTLGQPAKEPLQAPEAIAPTPASPEAHAEPTPIEAPPAPELPPSQPGEPEARPPTSTKNAVMEEERAARGESPIEKEAAREWGPAWEDAKAARAADSTLGDRVVAGEPTPGIDATQRNAILLQTKIEAHNEFHRVTEALDKAQQAGDAARVAELLPQQAAISDRNLAIDAATAREGAEAGRGLNARRMMAKEDFSLASMETQKRVANGGKALSGEQQGWVNDLYTRVAAAEKAIEEFQAGRGLPKPTKQTGKVLEFISAQADAARARIKARGSVAGALGDPATMRDYAIIGADFLAKDVRAFADWSSKMLGEFGEAIKPHLQDIYQRAQDFLSSTPKKAGAMQSRETRATNQIAHYQSLIDAGNFTPEPKRTPEPPSPRLQALQADLERVKGEYRAGLMKDRLASRSTSEKVQDAFTKWRTAAILSSPDTLVKLAAAATERIGIAPVEEGVGAGIAKALPAFGKRLYMEGGGSVRVEAKALAEGFTQGLRDIAQTLKTGGSDLDALYAKHPDMPRTALDFLWTLHKATKAPVVRNAFTRSFEHGAEWAIRNGLDPHDPTVQSRIALDAYKNAQRSVFMQDNPIVDAVNAGLRMLERPSKETGRPNPIGKGIATGVRVVMPIVKIPTNMVGEIGVHIGGLPTGAAKLAMAYHKGIETLGPVEADAIHRMLKKGALGSAALLVGYLNPQVFGGYYTGKRDKEDVPAMNLRAGGHDIPSLLLHNPLLEAFQIGATVRRVGDEARSKKDPEAKGFGAGMWAAAVGLLEEVPMIRTPIELAKLADPRERDAAAGRLLESMAVPAGVSWLARQIDREDGEQVKRAPKTILEHVEEGIPVLRQTLPEKVEKTPKLKLPGSGRGAPRMR